MECLTPTFGFDIFMDNYFNIFIYFVNIIQATDVLKKTRLSKCTIVALETDANKRLVATLNSAHQASVTLTVVGWNSRR